MDIEKIAKLAAISLGDEEKKKFQNEFKKIIEWISSLKELDTSDAKPFPYTQKPLDLSNDIPQDFAKKNLIIKNFTNKEYDFLKVKKVIDI
jgi:aspartyl/glutamyl-tRNA(Asn/Gln) amidotransferase C subunit